MDDWLYAKLKKCNGCGSDVKLVLSFIFLIIFALAILIYKFVGSFSCLKCKNSSKQKTNIEKVNFDPRHSACKLRTN